MKIYARQQLGVKRLDDDRPVWDTLFAGILFRIEGIQNGSVLSGR